MSTITPSPPLWVSFFSDIAVDASGTMYVTVTLGTSISKVTPSGVVSPFAGSLVSRLTRDSSGNFYVTCSDHSIRKVSPDGMIITTLAGMPGVPGSADGVGSAARFTNPAGIALDGMGNVYVADSGNATIRKITSDGVVTTLAGFAGRLGSADGPAAAATFNGPFGLVWVAPNLLYVTDRYNHTLRKITL